MNKAAALIHRGRLEAALEILGDVVKRFASDRRPELIDMIADAQTHRCQILEQLGRCEESVTIWQEVENQFGNSDLPKMADLVAGSSLQRSANLLRLNRLEDALAICDRAMSRLDGVNLPGALEAFAGILVNKGIALFHLSRREEALAVWGDIVRRFEASNAVRLRQAAVSALRQLAEHELSAGKSRSAIAFLDRALEDGRTGIPEDRLHGYLIRAKAHLAESNGEACVSDVERALTIFCELPSIPKGALVDLISLSAGIGGKRMCQMIESSPSSDLLLPLRTALERELGMEPRVAREVEEIAEDIRLELIAGSTSAELPGND